MLSVDLLLLGFPTASVGGPALGSRPSPPASPVTAGALLFDRPNARLLEEVLYFLLVRTSPSVCGERLREHWPVTSALQGRHFRQEAHRLVEELRRTGQLDREVILRKSMLDEGVGERLEEVLGRWAELLLLRECKGPEGETPRPEAPPMTGAALACEMLLESSPHARLTRHQQTIRTALGRLRSDPHSVVPAPTPRPL